MTDRPASGPKQAIVALAALLLGNALLSANNLWPTPFIVPDHRLSPEFVGLWLALMAAVARYGRLPARALTVFTALFLLFAMANAGLPATSGFIGEFMVVLGAIQFNFWTGFAAATTLILGAAYTLWMYKRVVFGDVANSHVAELSDINAREMLILGVLAICTLAMGIWPQPVTEIMHATVNQLLDHVAAGKL